MHPHRCHSPWHPQFPLWQSSTARASPTACPLLCSRPHAYPIHAILQISLPKPTTYMMTLAKNVKLCKVLSSPNYHIPQSFCCEAFIHPVKSINNNTIHTHTTHNPPVASSQRSLSSVLQGITTDPKASLKAWSEDLKGLRSATLRTVQFMQSSLNVGGWTTLFERY